MVEGNRSWDGGSKQKNIWLVSWHRREMQDRWWSKWEHGGCHMQKNRGGNVKICVKELIVSSKVDLQVQHGNTWADIEGDVAGGTVKKRNLINNCGSPNQQ